MMRTVFSVVASAVAMAVAVAVAPDAGAHAPDSRSAAPAAALVKQMEAKGLDAFAAVDPQEPGRYIAVLCFPGTQLLVVSAKYPTPKALEDLVAKRQFRDVYMDLQDPAAAAGRYFVQDMQADGLATRPGHGETMDVVYEKGVATRFDGDWQAQGLGEADYQAKFDAADQRYVAMLSALIAALNASK